MSRSSSIGQNRPSREKFECILDDDLQSIMNSIINEEYIRRETGADDIEAIIHLNLVIDTVEQSVFELSEILPNLKHLILDHSNIASIRDLGIGLRFLTSLSLSSCSLYDIDGIGVLIGLQELCLSDNYLTDVTPLAMHENIQVRWSFNP
jgi:Leucine-rich repeat (LRR) protein